MKHFKILLMTVFTILSVSLLAQDTTKNNTKMQNHNMEQVKYSCPMHTDVTSDKPGKCPRCGMTLVKSKLEAKEIYVCPMHPDVTSDKPGKCSKCGMDLTLSPKEKMNMEGTKAYSCPMHPDVTSSKPGKCPKCGMDLKAKNN